MNKPKKIPLRRCLATGEQFPKRELLRVVRTPEGNVIVDEKGKANGRGAYISRSLEAVEIAKKKKLFERELEVSIPDEVFEELIKIIGASNGESNKD